MQPNPCDETRNEFFPSHCNGQTGNSDKFLEWSKPLAQCDNPQGRGFEPQLQLGMAVADGSVTGIGVKGLDRVEEWAGERGVGWRGWEGGSNRTSKTA